MSRPVLGRPVAAMVAVAVLLALTTAPSVAESPPVVAPPTGVPTAEQSNISPYPVLARLGLWNGRTFAPVAAGSIPAGHAIFMSHGWSPGYLDAYQRLQAASPDLVTAWTPGLVDGNGDSLMTGFVALATALQQADPDAAVVMFSWVDQSATSIPLDARGPELATEVNGHRLATAIDEALAPGFEAAGGQVHLIGHSFGANIVTTAALAMTSPPRQLTLLDSPEVEIARIGGAKNDLQYKLPRLDLGRGPTQTFVDNYISFVGERYSTHPGLGAVVDVQTKAPDGTDGEKHSYAITWYTASITATGQAGQPQVGYAWSPLTGAEVATVGTSYEQPSLDAPLHLDELTGAPPAGVVEHLAVGVDPLGIAGAPSPTLGVSGSTPTTANLTFTTTGASLWLTFTTELHGRPGDLLTLFVDGRERYQSSPPDDGVGAAGAFVILYDVEPGAHVLSATIGGPTPSASADPSTTAELSSLAIATTGGITRNFTATQTTELAVGAVIAAVVVVVAVLGLIALLVIGMVRRRRRRRADHDGGISTTSP